MHSEYIASTSQAHGYSLLFGIHLLLKITLHTTLQRLASIILILILLLGISITRQASHSTTSGTFNP
jgi:hypothetical protein